MADRNEKLNEIFSNKELAKEVLSIAEPEDARKWFSDHGVEFSMDEIKNLGDTLNKIAKGELRKDGELSEGDMESVAGGCLYPGDIPDEVVERLMDALEEIFGFRW